MNVVYIYADTEREWNCSEWRCAVPARALNRAGRHSAQLLGIQDFAYNTPAAIAACEPADLLVVQRNLFGPVLTAIQHWKARDKVVIADFDDAYDLMPPSNPSYRFWAQGLGQRDDGQPVRIDPLPLTQFRWGLRLVHAATVASKRLASDWQDFTDPRYLPNFIDLEKYQSIRPEPHDGIWIGWGGSLTHGQSFAGSGVLAALKRVCQARPQVKVVIHGNDRRLFEQLPLPPAQKALRPWVPYTDWPRQLAGFDIGLAPLHGAYDERRSWIKVLEYLVLKIPWIASDSPPYADLRPYGWLVKNTPSAWERVLLDMVDHLADYKAEAGREPYLFGLSQAVDANTEKIVAIYSEIMAAASQPHAGRPAPAVPAGIRPPC
jgi:glycosyltransferase involved in cell wall biosynthesis